MLTRHGMANLVAERLNVDLTTAAIAVDTVIPIEAYDRFAELDTDEQELWLAEISDQLDIDEMGTD